MLFRSKNAGLVLNQSYKSVEHACLSVRILIGVRHGSDRWIGIRRDKGFRNLEQNEYAGFRLRTGAAAEIARSDSVLANRIDRIVGVELSSRPAIGIHIRQDADDGGISGVDIDDSVFIRSHSY